MPNTLTSIFVSNPATEPVEAPHPNTGVYVTGTQATVGGPWTVVHTLISKTATPLTMVGRLKNFPAVTVSVTATGGPSAGNIFNNILATPTGSAATGTSASAIGVAVSSIANQTAYRLFASDTSAGTYTQIYQGTAASFPHVGLTSAQTKYYKWQYVGGGFYDDSPLSPAFFGTVTPGVLAGVDLHLIGDSIIVGTRGGAVGNDLLAPIILSRFTTQNLRVTTHGYSGQNADYVRTQVAAIAATRDTTASKVTVAFVNLAANDVINFNGGQGARDHAALLTADLYAAGFSYVYFIEAMNRNDSYAANFFINTTRHFDDERVILRGLERANSPKYHDGTIALDATVLAATASTEEPFFFAVNDLDSLSKVHLTANGNHWYAEAMAQKAAVLLGATLPAITLPTPPAAVTPTTSTATFTAA